MKLINKLALASFVLITSLVGCNSQEKLLGHFVRTNGAGIGVSYDFEKHSKFLKVEYEHLMSKILYQGKLLTDGDTLILLFEPIDTLLPEAIVNSKRPIEDNTSEVKGELPKLITKINIVNKEFDPLPGVNMILWDINRELYDGYVSDSGGNYPSINLSNKSIYEFHFSFVGYQEFNILADDLYGYQTNLTVVLTSSALVYNQNKLVQKYIINEISYDKIDMTNLKNQQHVILERKTK